MKHLEWDTILLAIGLLTSLFFNWKQYQRNKKRDAIEDEERNRSKEKKLKFYLVQQGVDPSINQSHIELYFKVEIFNISEKPIHIKYGKIVFFDKGIPSEHTILLLKEDATFLGETIYPGSPAKNTLYFELENKSIIETASKNPFRIIIKDEVGSFLSSEDIQILFLD
ncbi:hypothetical protein GCM10027284_09410 [Cyclobacterium sediminis]